MDTDGELLIPISNSSRSRTRNPPTDGCMWNTSKPKATFSDISMYERKPRGAYKNVRMAKCDEVPSDDEDFYHPIRFIHRSQSAPTDFYNSFETEDDWGETSYPGARMNPFEPVLRRSSRMDALSAISNDSLVESPKRRSSGSRFPRAGSPTGRNGRSTSV